MKFHREISKRKVVEITLSYIGGKARDVMIMGAQRRFDGTAVARVRATTGHDSYERLVTIACKPSDHVQVTTALNPLPDLLQQPEAIGINTARILEQAHRDPNVVEFNRFYLERRENELSAAGNDARKRKKLEDDFTPQIDATLVALDGQVSWRVNVRVRYQLDGASYESELAIAPFDGRIEIAPALERCALTDLTVPTDCLASCTLSGTRAMEHRLARSEVSGRYALPEHLLQCSLSGKSLLIDEAGMSDITNAVIDRTLLKTCAVSGRKGEPIYFGQCAFTKTDVLNEQLLQSDISGKSYRLDQEAASVVSGKRGHVQEFVRCQETKRMLLPREAERCAKTDKIVAPDVLQPCAITGKRVLPGELAASSISGKRVLPEHLVTSSVSNALFLEEEGVRSAYGKFCAPIEAKQCQWSGAATHPDDIRTCALLGLAVHFQYIAEPSGRLQPVEDLLAGTRHTADAREHWDEIHPHLAAALKTGKCQIEAAQLSPDHSKLALAAEIKSMLGLRTQHAGVLYSLDQNAVLGRVAIVKRDRRGSVR